MNRRQFLSTPLAVALAAPGSKPPNFVILLTDDQGWADVGYHGSEIRTPHIDRFAAEGLRFDRFCSFPLCSPTRSALMTARNPVRLGVLYETIEPFNDYGVPVEEHFLPQTLKSAGYETAMAGKWHLGHTRRKYLPCSRGFDHSYGFINGRIDYYTHDREGGLDWHRDCHTLNEPGYSTDLIANEAIRLIRNRDKAKPLFLYVPFNAPHIPLEPPPRFNEHYANVKDKDRRVYAAMMEYVDDAIGRVLGALDEEQMTRDTVVLYFSDNGGATGSGGRNSPLRGGKRSTFEGGLRVPAALRWPGHITPGSRTAQFMTVTDVFPTFCGLAGIKPGNRLPLDGANLWPELSSSKIREREDIFFGTGSKDFFHYALYQKEWKLVREIPRESGEARNYLFRIEDDPNEQRDLAAANPQVVQKMSERVEQWRKLYPKDGIFVAKKTAGPGEHAPKQWVEAALPD